ncbi:MAG: radical SAM family heme chaperone HemW [Proteobacteria bacterium]|nr:radical SAM family heme chaperone HemW [Pseudomonadota bacterium]
MTKRASSPFLQDHQGLEHSFGRQDPVETLTPQKDHCPAETSLPGLYVHIPFCIQKCAYCGFYSSTDRTQIPAYLKALSRETDLYRGWAACFDTLYIGGGTPSVLPAGDLEGLIAALRTAFRIAAEAEITVETNPADITPGLLAGLHRAGVNRINIGVQSFNDETLAFLGRRHDRRQAVAAVAAARTAGIENIGLDLIYGVPGQGMDAWLATLCEAAALNPDHLSCYQLTLETATPLAERCRRKEVFLPDESLQADFFLKTSEFLEEAGYVHYEISNFARTGAESRHNRKYWNHAPYLGLGPAAHSFRGRERRWNRRSLPAYLKDLAAGRPPVEASEILTDEQLRLEALFLGFRTRRGIRLDDVQRRYHYDLLAKKGKILTDLAEKGLVEIRDGFLRPTRAGMAVADSLALI